MIELTSFGLKPLWVAIAGVAALIGVAGSRWARSSSRETFRRGAVVRSGAPLALRRGSPGDDRLLFAGVRLRREDEARHFKIVGTTGTGKSTAIRELLEAAMRRGDRAVIADPDGSYSARLFDRYRGDVVLNPFEADSRRWDPFAEISDDYDIEHLASALIPVGAESSAAEWRAYARTFLGALLRSGCRMRRQSGAELWRWLSEAPAAELRPLLAGSAAQPFLDPDNARMFGSIRAVAVSALAALAHVGGQRAAPFSIREWVVRRDSRSSLFIPYRARHIAALRSLVATWMRIAIFEALNGDESQDRRLWFVVDELDALGTIDGLKDALVRLRKFGGRCVLGFQSIAQVSGVYGGPDAQTIIENCGNTLILRCSSSEQGGTSQFASRLIGEREIVRDQVSRGRDRESAFSMRGARRSWNVSRQQVTEPAVLASQIEQLADFCGYVKLASAHEWRKVRFSPARRGAAR